jgi:hypothetical protein
MGKIQIDVQLGVGELVRDESIRMTRVSASGGLGERVEERLSLLVMHICFGTLSSFENARE